MTHWCQCVGVPGQDYLDVLIANLEGTLAQWMGYIDREVSMERQVLYNTFQEITRDLNAYFEPQNTHETLCDAIATLKQMSTMLV